MCWNASDLHSAERVICYRDNSGWKSRCLRNPLSSSFNDVDKCAARLSALRGGRCTSVTVARSSLSLSLARASGNRFCRIYFLRVGVARAFFPQLSRFFAHFRGRRRSDTGVEPARMTLLKGEKQIQKAVCTTLDTRCRTPSDPSHPFRCYNPVAVQAVR